MPYEPPWVWFETKERVVAPSSVMKVDSMGCLLELADQYMMLPEVLVFELIYWRCMDS
jgi:hypothetical protein